MNKRTFAGIATAGVLLLAAVSGSGNTSQSSKLHGIEKATTAQPTTAQAQPVPKAKPICDGTTVTTNCTADGTTYSTYIYHAAIPEKSHVTTTTTYEKKITDYCTLCNDNTYSPSCATGRGACSYHGGVQQWNAPRYSEVPVTNTDTVVDAPAQNAYYDKVPQQ